MKNIEPISETLIKDWNEARQNLASLEDKIINRIDFVLNTLFEVFNGKLINWYFSDADEGEIGDLYRNLYSSNVNNIFTEENKWKSVPNIAIIDKYGNEWHWNQTIPIRWLFDADFRKEIEEGKALYELRQKQYKELKEMITQKSRMKNDELALEALKKLTSEELYALKNKFVGE